MQGREEPARVEFRLAETLSEAERLKFLDEVVRGPYGPSDTEVGPNGVGWAEYEELIESERIEIEKWFRNHALVRDFQIRATGLR